MIQKDKKIKISKLCFEILYKSYVPKMTTFRSFTKNRPLFYDIFN